MICEHQQLIKYIFLINFLWLMIHLYKTHVVKFIISLISSIQILVYYLLEMSLITYTVISFASFFVLKFVISLVFFQQKKNILQNKKNGFLLYKNYDIKHQLNYLSAFQKQKLFKWVPQKKLFKW